MAENVTNELMYELLKQLNTKFDRFELKLDDVAGRVSSLEVQYGELASQVARTNIRLDRLDERVSRIERNLDLVRG